jgi:hypothetical protein
MDGGTILNIIYADTLDFLGSGGLRSNLGPRLPMVSPPGKRVHPLGQIDLPIFFGTPTNFRKETLTFEVVGFRGTYHAVLEWPCYAKFMVVPNYTYLKLKILGPAGIIMKGKCALGPFLSILVIECQHKVLKCKSMPMDEQSANHK